MNRSVLRFAHQRSTSDRSNRLARTITVTPGRIHLAVHDQPRAPSVLLRGDDDDAGQFFARDERKQIVRFLGGAVGLIEDANHLPRHAEAAHHLDLQVHFARVLEMPRSTSTRFAPVRDLPEQVDARRPAFLVKLDRFHRPLVHRAAEHHHGVGFLQRIFDDEPRAKAREGKSAEQEKRRREEGAADEDAFQLDELRPHEPGPEKEAKSIRLARLPFNQPHVSSPRTLLRFLDGELDALALPKQLEHRAPNGAAMKEMLQAGFITDEAEALVD